MDMNAYEAVEQAAAPEAIQTEAERRRVLDAYHAGTASLNDVRALYGLPPLSPERLRELGDR